MDAQKKQKPFRSKSLGRQNTRNRDTVEEQPARKGILKSSKTERPLSFLHNIYVTPTAILPTRLKELQSSPTAQSSRLKLGQIVGFSDSNAVAIFGDTSDDNTTEPEYDSRPISLFSSSKMSSSPTAIVTPIRQTNILLSESEESEWSNAPRLAAVSTTTDHNLNDLNIGTKTTMSNTTEPNGGEVITHLPAESSSNIKHPNHAPSINEKHLNELRERLKEIEGMMTSNQVSAEIYSDNMKLYDRLKQREEEYRQEKQALIDKHEIHVRQLNQEIVDARAETMRKAQQLENAESRLRVEKVDKTCMTDDSVLMPDYLTSGIDGEGTFPDKISPSEAMKGNESPRAMGSTSPHINRTLSKQYQMAVTQETINQLEAYRNEALIWRTKTAQLEIVIKELMRKCEEAESAFKNRLTKKSLEVEKLHETVRKMSLVQSTTTPDREAEQERTSTPALVGECQLDGCVDRKRKLINENENLLRRVDQHVEKIHSLEKELSKLHDTYEKKKHELASLESLHEELGRLAEERLYECKAAQMTISELQTQKDTLNRAVEYLESRCQAYQNVILDNGLVVHDESSENWKRGFSEPQYSVRYSKRVQTEMTIEELASNEGEFVSLRKKLREIEAEFTQEQENVHNKLVEIEQSLMLKTALVDQLTKQLEIYAKESQIEAKQRQEERNISQGKLNGLGRIAERVPILEAEIELAMKAKSSLEVKFRRAQEDYEENLEISIAETLKKYHNQNNYWKEKVYNLENARKQCVNHLNKLKTDFEELKLRHKMERAELEMRLASSIDHINVLNNRLNCPRRDAQCDARPKTTNKYVACKPNHRHKPTTIEKGDFVDEVLENCRLDLAKARNRIENLQIKLWESAMKTNKRRPKEKPSRRSMDRDVFESDTLHLQVASDSSISLVSSPTVLYEDRSETPSVGKANTTKSKPHLHYGKENQLVQDFKHYFENKIKELNQGIDKQLGENVRLNEKVIELENELYSYRNEKEKISHVSYLVPSMIVNSDAIDDTEVIRICVARHGSAGPEIRKTDDNKRTTKARSMSPQKLEEVRYGRVAKGSSIYDVRIEPGSKWQWTENQIAKPIDKMQKVMDIVGNLVEKNKSSTSMDKEVHVKLSELIALHKLCKDLESALIAWTKQNDNLPPEDKSEIRKLRRMCEFAEKQLKEAEMELEIYRMEPREEALKRRYNVKLTRSRSAVGMESCWVNAEEQKRWKEMASVTFREKLEGNKLTSDRRQSNPMIPKVRLFDDSTNGAFGSLPDLANEYMCSSHKPAPSKKLAKSQRKSSFEEPIMDTQSGKYKTAMGKSDGTERELRIIREAFKTQISALRKRNTELEGQVKLIGSKNESENEQLATLKQEMGKFQAENSLLHNENQMYEQKIREVEEERHNMLLAVLRKGQKAVGKLLDEHLDPETEDRMTLKFLREAFYYFLLHNGNSREHIQAIMTVLNFTNSQKEEVYSRRGKSN
ncbi:hypothetical protein DdX_07379 [Ditylenchus destructor]|uniref:GRIP domain-containing protein n=1 Tax=Ditylenchus destructor TaxID=166010 RepID=A0AAD4N9Q8_9BILA|nr:hypothetical protein DdX_07379 [Ditylenchus destructor]